MQVVVNCVCTDLVSGLDQMKGKVDVLLFNPPYVPTDDEEVRYHLSQVSTYHNCVRRSEARG